MQHRISQTKQNRNMKEKLLHAAESIQDMENSINGLVSPATPATPGTSATFDTPTTPLSPATPSLTIHGDGKHHAAGVISFSRASGFFAEGAMSPGQEPPGPDAGGGSSDTGSSSAGGTSMGGGVCNEALSPKTGHEGSPTSPRSGTKVTDTQVRGVFESPILKTEHYRSLSENYTNSFLPTAADTSERCLNREQLALPHPSHRAHHHPHHHQHHHPHHHHHHPAKATHTRSSSATVPASSLCGAAGTGAGAGLDAGPGAGPGPPSRRAPYVDTRSASLNSDTPGPAHTALHAGGSDPAMTLQTQQSQQSQQVQLSQQPQRPANHEMAPPFTACRSEGLAHTDISIEVS